MESMKEVAARPLRVLIAVECTELKQQLCATLQRFRSQWTVDPIEAVGPFDERSIVSAPASAVKHQSDVVLYASSTHNSESVASHFLDQRDSIAFVYRQPDCGDWRVLVRNDSVGTQLLGPQMGSLLDLIS